MNNQFYCQKQTLILECTEKVNMTMNLEHMDYYKTQFTTPEHIDGNLTINYSHARLTHSHVLNTPNASYQLKV